MTEIAMKGALLKSESGIQDSILQFFQDAVKKKLFDAVMLPMKVPSGDSFAWIMIKEQHFLKDAQPLAPIRIHPGTFYNRYNMLRRLMLPKP